MLSFVFLMQQIFLSVFSTYLFKALIQVIYAYSIEYTAKGNNNNKN